MAFEEGNGQQLSAFVGDFGDHYVETRVHVFPVDITHFPAVIC